MVGTIWMTNPDAEPVSDLKLDALNLFCRSPDGCF